ncbi:MAG: hypothetical protein WKF77_30935, partial [Planctomycetaceae bacterium]
MSQPSRSTPRKRTPCSSALVNQELAQRKPYVLSREIRCTYLHVRFIDRQNLHRPTMLVCSGSQQRSLYCLVAFQRRQEGPNHEEQGGATDVLG